VAGFIAAGDGYRQRIKPGLSQQVYHRTTYPGSVDGQHFVRMSLAGQPLAGSIYRPVAFNTGFDHLRVGQTQLEPLEPGNGVNHLIWFGHSGYNLAVLAPLTRPQTGLYYGQRCVILFLAEVKPHIVGDYRLRACYSGAGFVG
jgi:hypothetical protein